ncbi:MAG: hypothetical protein ACKV2V_31450 [Blastocatellia bacterium]
MSEMETTLPRVLVGLFEDRQAADRAYQTLRRLDYSPDVINVLMSEDAHQKALSAGAAGAPDAQGGPDQVGTDTVKSTKAAEGAALGTTAGAAIGAIAMLGAAVVMPGAGILFLGPLAAGVAGAGLGATIGGLFGALVGSGHPEEKYSEYETAIREGKIFISVSPRTIDEANLIRREWQELGGRVSDH